MSNNHHNIHQKTIKFISVLLLLCILCISHIFASEKESQKPGSKNSETKIKLKHAKMNLYMEFKRAVLSLLPKNFRIKDIIRYDNKYLVYFSAPNADNREHIASVLNIMNKLYNSSYSAFMTIDMVGIYGIKNEKLHHIQLTFPCRIKSEKKESETDNSKPEEKFALFIDTLREVFLIKPKNINFITFYNFGFGKYDATINFHSSNYPKSDNFLEGVSHFMKFATYSRYFVVAKIRDSYSYSTNPIAYCYIDFKHPKYSPPYSKTVRQKLLESILKVNPPNLNLKKVNFNKASKGFIVETSSYTKDKAAVLKSIVDFIEKIHKMDSSLPIVFDRLVIHISRDKSKPANMFIEMREYGEVSKKEKNKEHFTNYKESRIQILQKAINQNHDKVFEDGFTLGDGRGRFLILTVLNK